MDLEKKYSFEGVYWIHLAEDRICLWAIMNSVMNCTVKICDCVE
jgi:hypothetical protein